MNSDSKKQLKGDIMRVVLVVLFFVVAGVVMSRYIKLEGIRQYVHSHGTWGYVVFLLSSGVLQALGVPRLWISAAAGGFFGAFWGIVFGQFASMVGASLNFYIGRLLLRGPVTRNMPERMKPLYEKFNANGFRWLIYLRLLPISNATVTNLVGGVSSISFGSFFLSSFIGFLPETVIFAMAGSSAVKGSIWQGVSAAVLLVIIVVVERACAKQQKRQDLEAAKAAAAVTAATESEVEVLSHS